MLALAMLLVVAVLLSRPFTDRAPARRDGVCKRTHLARARRATREVAPGPPLLSWGGLPCTNDSPSLPSSEVSHEYSHTHPNP